MGIITSPALQEKVRASSANNDFYNCCSKFFEGLLWKRMHKPSAQWTDRRVCKQAPNDESVGICSKKREFFNA